MPDKMKCAKCGRRFKTNKNQVLCDDCLAKERKAKRNAPQLVPSARGGTMAVAGTGTPQHMDRPAPPPTVTIVATSQPPEPNSYGSRARRDEREQTQTTITAATTQSATPPLPTTPAEPATATAPQTKPAPSAAKQPAAVKPEKRPRKTPHTAPPFELTDEIRASIEARYQELANPLEFDGIRTQIATELNVPKPVVKKVVGELRKKLQLPSWWDLQAFRGNDEELERIRQRYVPQLPLPPVGVHKQIAADLHMDAPQVYQAIRRLRAELKLPQYNPPEAHQASEPAPSESNGTFSRATANTAEATSPE